MGEQTNPQPADDTTATLTKLVIAVLLGPKISPYIVAIGLPNDPALYTVLVGGILHKAHLLLKQETNWSWL